MRKKKKKGGGEGWGKEIVKSKMKTRYKIRLVGVQSRISVMIPRDKDNPQ